MEHGHPKGREKHKKIHLVRSLVNDNFTTNALRFFLQTAFFAPLPALDTPIYV